MRQKLVREMAIEHDALPREKAQCWDACGKLIHEIHVIGGCLRLQ
jgi:hypothetical protein